MLKKITFFICWLLILMTALLFCFTFGLWQDWRTPAILMLWIVTLIVISIFWQVSPYLRRIITTKQWRRWIVKFNLSRRDYLLLSQWKQGAAVIKRLRRQRKPLPWYILLGDRCGKSTLLSSADVPRFDNYFEEVATGPTRSLHWWFFRQICILELSSNFLKSNPRYRQTWQTLTRWWHSMPAPSGIIVAIPCSALLTDDLTALHALMRQQRVLIEPLIKNFGKSTALHILITQCDTLPEFTFWSAQLSAAQLREPIGYSWPTTPQIDGQDPMLLYPLFSSLHQGFNRVRLSMIRPKNLSPSEYDSLLNLPQAIAALEPKLRYAIAALAEPNAYFSHLPLSSVWLSAAVAMPDNHNQRTSLFIDKLLTEHLHKISLNHALPRWYQGGKGRLWAYLTLFFCGLWLVTSLGYTLNRLQFGLGNFKPNQLASFIAKDENIDSNVFGYLPFEGIVHKQYRRAENRLMQTPTGAKSIKFTLDKYKQAFFTANLRQQRQMILNLTHAILTWQQMQNGAKLMQLSTVSPIEGALTQRVYPNDLSVLALMGLERGYIQRHEGDYWLQQARICLKSLVNHTSNIAWLTAPDDAFPDLTARQFWSFMSDKIMLPGLWTQAGQHTIANWIDQIETAIGQPQPILHQTTLFDEQLRQNAWEKFLIELTAELNVMPARTLPLDELIALGQNQSQAMQFIERTHIELQDISLPQAQPWLSSLRDLHKLILLEAKSSIMRKISKKTAQLRKSFLSFIRQQPTLPKLSQLMPAQQSLEQWLTARGRAVNEAVAQPNPTRFLARGLFASSHSAEDNNPILPMFPALTKVKDSLSIKNDNAGVTAVWLLYRDDARSLASHAIAQSACWLNQQWKVDVIWPLDQRSETQVYPDLQLDSKLLVSGFLQDTAKPFLINSRQGQTAAQYAGIGVPFNAHFIRLIRGSYSADMIQDLPKREAIRNQERLAQVQQQRLDLADKKNQLEQKNWTTTIATLPATISDGAQVLPIGTQLILHCQTGDQQISSMNLADKRQFVWQPGLCSGLTLKVQFPNFMVRYHSQGFGAWPEFLHRLTRGQISLASQDFTENAELLTQLGIKHILVRFQVVNPVEFYPVWLNWRDMTNRITDLDKQTLSLTSQAEAKSFQPISHLPVDIAQCN